MMANIGILLLLSLFLLIMIIITITITTLCLKKWGMHIVLHNFHKNRALQIKFGTVNPKSISYNLALELLMLWSTSCSHCHDNHRACQLTPALISPDF